MIDASLLDLRADRIGITFQRNKVLNPFVYVAASGEPLLDVLFSMTRPPMGPRPPRVREIAAETRRRELALEAFAAMSSEDQIELPKAMVPYRRERFGMYAYSG